MTLIRIRTIIAHAGPNTTDGIRYAAPLPVWTPDVYLRRGASETARALDGMEITMKDYQEEIRALTRAQNRIDGLYYQAARRLGVKDNTLALFYALDDGQPHSQKQLGEEWLIPKTTVNTIVKELVKEGFLTLLMEEHTKEKQILLTPEGRRYAASLLKPVYRMEQEALRATLQKHGSAFLEANADFAENLKNSFDRIFETDTGKES